MNNKQEGLMIRLFWTVFFPVSYLLSIFIFMFGVTSIATLDLSFLSNPTFWKVYRFISGGFLLLYYFGFGAFCYVRSKR